MPMIRSPQKCNTSKDSRPCRQKYNNQSKHVLPTNTKKIADNLVTYSKKKHFLTSNVFIGFQSGIFKVHIVSLCVSYRRINRSMKRVPTTAQNLALEQTRCLRNEFYFQLVKVSLTNCQVEATCINKSGRYILCSLATILSFVVKKQNAYLRDRFLDGSFNAIIRFVYFLMNCFNFVCLNYHIMYQYRNVFTL